MSQVCADCPAANVARCDPKIDLPRLMIDSGA